MLEQFEDAEAVLNCREEQERSQAEAHLESECEATRFILFLRLDPNLGRGPRWLSTKYEYFRS